MGRNKRKKASLNLVFVELSLEHEIFSKMIANGMRDGRRWVAKNGDEFVRVISSQDPAGKGGSYEGHVSISVAKDSAADVQPVRLPTKEECDCVLDFLRLDKSAVQPLHSQRYCHFWHLQKVTI